MISWTLLKSKTSGALRSDEHTKWLSLAIVTAWYSLLGPGTPGVAETKQNKTFCSTKDTIKRTERRATELEKIFAEHIIPFIKDLYPTYTKSS